MKAQGVKKGDAVAIYMPMLCELPISMVRPCTTVGMNASSLKTLAGVGWRALQYSSFPENSLDTISRICDHGACAATQDSLSFFILLCRRYLYCAKIPVQITYPAG